MKRMMNPKDVTNLARQVNVGQYVRCHYDTKSNDTHLKDDDIVKHLSKNSTQILTCYYHQKENQKQHNNHCLPVNDVSN